MWIRTALGLLVLGLVAGCGDDAAMGPQGPRVLDTDTPLPPDVAAVIAEHCHECHGEPLENFAPMSIVNWEDTQAPAPSNKSIAVFESIDNRINAAMWPMPPTDRPPMPAENLKTLNDWIADGAPSGD